MPRADEIAELVEGLKRIQSIFNPISPIHQEIAARALDAFEVNAIRLNGGIGAEREIYTFSRVDTAGAIERTIRTFVPANFNGAPHPLPARDNHELTPVVDVDSSHGHSHFHMPSNHSHPDDSVHAGFSRTSTAANQGEAAIPESWDAEKFGRFAHYSLEHFGEGGNSVEAFERQEAINARRARIRGVEAGAFSDARIHASMRGGLPAAEAPDVNVKFGRLPNPKLDAVYADLFEDMAEAPYLPPELERQHLDYLRGKGPVPMGAWKDGLPQGYTFQPPARSYAPMGGCTEAAEGYLFQPPTYTFTLPEGEKGFFAKAVELGAKGFHNPVIHFVAVAVTIMGGEALAREAGAFFKQLGVEEMTADYSAVAMATAAAYKVGSYLKTGRFTATAVGSGVVNYLFEKYPHLGTPGSTLDTHYQVFGHGASATAHVIAGVGEAAFGLAKLHFGFSDVEDGVQAFDRVRGHFSSAGEHAKGAYQNLGGLARDYHPVPLGQDWQFSEDGNPILFASPGANALREFGPSMADALSALGTAFVNAMNSDAQADAHVLQGVDLKELGKDLLALGPKALDHMSGLFQTTPPDGGGPPSRPTQSLSETAAVWRAEFAKINALRESQAHVPSAATRVATPQELADLNKLGAAIAKSPVVSNFLAAAKALQESELLPSGLVEVCSILASIVLANTGAAIPAVGVAPAPIPVATPVLNSTQAPKETSSVSYNSNAAAAFAAKQNEAKESAIESANAESAARADADEGGLHFVISGGPSSEAQIIHPDGSSESESAAAATETVVEPVSLAESLLTTFASAPVNPSLSELPPGALDVDARVTLQVAKSMNDLHERFWEPSADSFAANLSSLYSEAEGVEQVFSAMGFGLGTANTGFSAHLRTAGLIDSYLASNPTASFHSLPGAEKVIGGVGNKLGLIQDMIDSPEQDVSEYVFCFPTTEGAEPCRAEQLRQIARELAQGIFVHQSSVPLVSFGFAKKGHLVPDLPPAYQNTLVGKIMIDLDYYLKGILNDATYDEKFINEWYEKGMSLDDGLLRGKLTNFKKELKDHYVPLREMMRRAGVNMDFIRATEAAREAGAPAYDQPFMSSFRIIAKTEKIERSGNVLIVHPDFDIKCDIDLMPPYKAFIELYHQEHGCYPEEYQRVLECYEQFRAQLKSYLLKLPRCRELMNMLGIINFYCNFYTTLKEMGKMPVLDLQTSDEDYRVPAAFPPLSVRDYQAHPLDIAFGELVMGMRAIELEDPALAKIDVLLKDFFATEENKLPSVILLRIETIIRRLMLAKLGGSIADINSEDLNQTEVDRLVSKVAQLILSDAHLCRRAKKIISSRELMPPQLWLRLRSSLSSLTNLFGLSEESEDFLTQFIAQLGAFTENYMLSLGGNPRGVGYLAASINITKEYLHSTTAFKAYEEGRNRFELKGGCSVTLSNCTTVPVTNPSALEGSLALAKEARPAETRDSPETWSSMVYEGRSYAVSTLPVVDNPVLSVADKLSLERSLRLKSASAIQVASAEEVELFKAALGRLTKNPADLPALALDMTKSLDTSGARFIHYAAAILPALSLEKIMSLAAGQLRLADHAGYLAIHTAASFGNLSAIKMMLESDPTLLDAMSLAGETALIIAVQNGKKEVVEFLLEKGANANHIMPNELFALYLAIQSGFSEIASLLAKKLPEHKEGFVLANGMTALHLAIQYRFFDLAEELVVKKSWLNVARKSDGFTPLHLAASLGNKELVLKIIAQGINVNLAVASGKTALHIAAENGHFELVEALLTLDALKVDAQTLNGDTALMLAIKNRHLKVAELLAEKSAVNLSNEKKQTASLLAAEHNFWSVFDILFKRGEGAEFRDYREVNAIYYLLREGDMSRFDWVRSVRPITMEQVFSKESLAAIAERYGHFSMADELRARDAHLTKEEILYRATMAVQNDQVVVLRSCLSALSPLQLASLACVAAERASLDCLKLLRASLTAEDAIVTKRKMLIAAVQSREWEAVKLCLPGVEAALDDEGNTILHYVARFGCRELWTHLKGRFKATVRNAKGETAFHIAILNNDAYLLKRLMKATLREEWPRDLYKCINAKSSAMVMKLLSANGCEKPPSTELMAPEVAMADFDILKLKVQKFLDSRYFYEISNLIKENPLFIAHYNRQASKPLLRELIDRISANFGVSETDEIRKIKEIELTEIKELLLELKKQGIRPSEYRANDNPLRSLLNGDDKQACDRFTVYAEIFPESLPELLLDNIPNELSLIQAVLMQNKVELFRKLSDFIPGFVPLNEAILADRNSLALSLLNSNNSNVRDQYQKTPLMCAAQRGNIRLMQALLDQGANPDAQDREGRTALYYAVSENQSAAALFLLPFLRIKHKNKADRSGCTPLFIAIAKGMSAVVKALVETGEIDSSQVNAMGQNALHYAAIYNQVELIQYLVDQGFEIDQKERPLGVKKKAQSQGRTALHLAAMVGKVAAVDKLRKLGAKITETDRYERTVFEYALMSKNKEVWRYLSQWVKDEYPKHKSTLILAAAQFDNNDILVDLLLEGENPNATNPKNGYSALQLAAANNAIAATRSLLTAKASVDLLNSKNNDETALHVAAQAGHVVIVDLLVKAGAAVNKLSRLACTPLYLASQAGKIAAVKNLLKHGAKFSLSDSAGISPAQIAFINGHVDIAAYLLGRGDDSLLPEKVKLLRTDLQLRINAQEEKLEHCRRHYRPASSSVGDSVSAIRGTLFAVEPLRPAAVVSAVELSSAVADCGVA